MMADSAPGFGERLKKRMGLIVGVAVGLLLVVALVVFHYSGRESTDDAQVDGHINPVSSRVSGTVLKVDVLDNQEVAAGTVLVEIDPKDYDVALSRARADLSEAQASASAADTNVPLTSATTEARSTTADSDAATARARLAEAQARLLEAQARETKASNDLTRVKALIDRDEVSKQEFDAVSTAAVAATAARESANAAVVEAQKGVVAADARVGEAKTGPQQVAMMKARAASAQAKIDQAKATVQLAELNLQYATIKAPVAGIISRKSVEVGQIVQAGQPLLALVPLEGLWVTANFKENQLRDMRVGQKAEVSVDAFGGRTFTGKVDSIAAATGARFSLLPPENASGNYVKVVQRVPVKITLDSPTADGQTLRPGMSVEPVVFTR
jgi:membrane fusion protein (multidrug efflux system)